MPYSHWVLTLASVSDWPADRAAESVNIARALGLTEALITRDTL
jgi:hypothetical protein